MPTTAPQNSSATYSRTVLIARFSAIGDVAMTIPVVYSVCRANPDVRFVYLTRPSMTTMMVNPPANLVPYPADVSGRYHSIGGLCRLFGQVNREYRITAFADLHTVLRTGVLATLCRLRGIPVARLYKARRQRRALTRPLNKVMLPLTPQHTRYAEVFQRLGLTVTDTFTTLFPADAPVQPEQLLASAKVHLPTDKHLIAIAPFAAHQGKIYPTHLMEQVIEALASNPRNSIWLLGGGGHEARTMEKWADRHPGVTSLAGKRLGFPVELALLSRMHAVVSMDSANMHLASLVGVPVVAIWGATHPYCGFRAFGQSDDTALQLTMTCRPCSIFGNKPCQRGDYHCLNGISPTSVVARINDIIHQPNKK